MREVWEGDKGIVNPRHTGYLHAMGDQPSNAPQPRRNKGFDETHREMIETAVRLISEKGAEALSVAAIAREMGINRTTVYYHFENREALLQAVSSWATEQLATGMDVNASRPERTAHISRFVLENPELIKLWIEEFVSGKDIRASYSKWDELVEGTQGVLDRNFPGQGMDAEVYCVMMLAAAIIGPRVYANSIRPGTPVDAIVERFVAEHQRVLTRDGLAIDR
ncbi:MAG: TetR/AcrR family transcriptional regulator [Novosphingobium sp.]